MNWQLGAMFAVVFLLVFLVVRRARSKGGSGDA